MLGRAPLHAGQQLKAGERGESADVARQVVDGADGQHAEAVQMQEGTRKGDGRVPVELEHTEGGESGEASEGGAAIQASEQFQLWCGVQ